MCCFYRHSLITFKKDEQSEERWGAGRLAPFFMSQYDVCNDLVADAVLKSSKAAWEDHAS